MALETRGLCRSFGALRATDDVSLAVAPGELHALIGPNGAGKTTLISLVAGEIAPDRGSVHLLGRDVTALGVPARARAGLGRSFQVTQLFGECSAERNVALALLAGRGHPFRAWRPVMAEPGLRAEARAVLGQAGIAAAADTRAADLSHGERRQLELALVMARRPPVLLLDEPMAGLGPQESVEMTRTIRALKGHAAILLVEHDMDAVFALADRVSVLVCGAVVSTGRPEAIRRDERVQRAYLGAPA